MASRQRSPLRRVLWVSLELLLAGHIRDIINAIVGLDREKLIAPIAFGRMRNALNPFPAIAVLITTMRANGPIAISMPDRFRGAFFGRGHGASLK